MTNPNKPIKLAVVGGRRGGSFRQALKSLADRLELTAICDLSEEVLSQWRGRSSRHPYFHQL